MWICVFLASCTLLLHVKAFCPSSCLCDEVNPSVKCAGAQLSVVPSLLNPHLKRLNLAYNTIQNINDVLQYYELLEELDLSQNRLSSIGEENFRHQTKLRDLNLSFNNLTRLDSRSLYGLRSLNRLDLSHNSLTAVYPDVLIYSPNLKILILAKNRLHSLTVKTFQGIQQLQSLDLCDNIFRAIPKSALHPLQNLETLELCRNRLTYIKAFDLVNPKLLSVSFLSNSISHIDSNAFRNLTKLVTLNLNDNLLDDVPTKSFRFLQSLEALHMSRNKLTVIRNNAFSGLKNLLVLDVTRCPLLEYIEPKALYDCKRLSSVILSHNPLVRYIPPELFSRTTSLRVLNLKANGLQTISEETVPLHSLKSLDLRDNPLVCNCSLLWLGAKLALQNRTVDIADIRCSAPDKLRGIYLSRISSGQLLCVDPLLQVIVCVSIICLSTALIAGLFFLVCRYRRRPHMDKLSSNCGWIEGPLRPLESSWPPEEHHTPASHIISDDYFYHTFPSLRKVPVTEV